MTAVPEDLATARQQFADAATCAGARRISSPIDAAAADGSPLTIEVAIVGSETPDRALVVLSGVHGVEAPIGAAIQCAALERCSSAALGRTAVVFVHGVNPWGWAWSRRQNEHNIDLNRNWRRSSHDPEPNPNYDELHPLACPDADELPDADAMLEAAGALIATRGAAWLRDAITGGQYRHADGLHYGGRETEASNRALERILADHLSDVEQLLTVDLHTGHGPYGEVTMLSAWAPSTAEDGRLRAIFPDHHIDATVDNPNATTGLKQGQIANGFAASLPSADALAITVEFGTADDIEQLVATYHEQWVYRRGDRARPDHAAAVERYRRCFTPDDPDWVVTALADGRIVFDHALAAVT